MMYLLVALIFFFYILCTHFGVVTSDKIFFSWVSMSSLSCLKILSQNKAGENFVKYSIKSN